MLRKSLSLSDSQIKLDESSGIFSGYASVFGGVDSYGDTIVRGAFDYTLRTHGKPKMFFNHAWLSLPIGKYVAVKEDDHGLYVEGQLTKGNPEAEGVHAALKHGTLDGLSIGYYMKKGDYDETEEGRVIRRVSRLAEVSVVTWPADEAARVDLDSVKSEDIEAIETVKDFERFLRDVGGLSNGLAKAIIVRAKQVFSVREVHDSGDAKANENLLARLEALASMSALR